MAVLAIPIASAICARAAVGYTQTKRNLSLRQALALADRGWWDPGVLTRVLTPHGVGKYGTLLSAKLLSYDADVTGFTQLSANTLILDTTSWLETGSYFDQQPQLWQDPSMECNDTVSTWYKWCYTPGHSQGTYTIPIPGDKYWVSNLANTIATGLFQEHSLRLNSSLHCQNVTESSFPSSCDSSESFQTFTSTELLDSSGNSNGTFEFRVCVPNVLDRNPWNLTRNCQDISENAYIQFNADAVKYMTDGLGNKSVTLMCSSNTTAGYFSLPNAVSQPLAGPLQTTFNISAPPEPTEFINPESAGQSWANYGPALGDPGFVPNNMDPNPIHGPLTTSLISLFGPGTFFATRANSTFTNSTTPSSPENCTDSVPFSNLIWDAYLGSYIFPSCASTDHSQHFQNLTNFLAILFDFKVDGTSSPYYTHNETISEALTASLFYANRALLSRAASTPRWRRGIFTDDGVLVKTFTVSNWAIVAISTILAIHLLGLWGLALFAFTHPTWTHKLDGWALIRMGAALAKDRDIDLPLLANINAEEADVLDCTDGWVGEAADYSQSQNNDPLGVKTAYTGREQEPPAAAATGEEEEAPRIIVFGGPRPLRSGAKYAVYRAGSVIQKLEERGRGRGYGGFLGRWRWGYQKLFSRETEH
ncbi:MAG: hypothetical protein Q9227_007402 [Pyrenula ochraceoflavens]